MIKEDEEEVKDAFLAALGIKPLGIQKMNQAPTPPQRPAHEVLIDEFMELDKQCQELLGDFTSGNVIYKCVPQVAEPQGIDAVEFVNRLAKNFMSYQEYLKLLIEKRNAKLQEASNALRGMVMAAENVTRGPDGKSSFLKYGPFEVASKTFRSFTPATLAKELQDKGLYSRLLELSTIDKDSGQSIPAFAQEWVVRYEPIKNWLREQNLEAVLQTAYEEEEGTPAVTGPKELGWLGDTLKKKGKKG